MSIKSIFQAFFSYAHIDGVTDPEMIKSFTASLQKRVDARLTNAGFEIWIDAERLKVGYQWDSRILESLKDSKIMIVLLTPKWIESDYCRKEYTEFLRVESNFDIGEYIAPILARPLDGQVKHFTDAQKEIFHSISERQYTKVLSKEFSGLDVNERNILLESLADDIAGMIERHRAIENEPAASPRPRRKTIRQTAEFDSTAHNFEEVELLRSAEVEIEASNGSTSRAVFAHIGFTPRMYVQTSTMRVEFGVRRAMLSIESDQGNIDRIEQWEDSSVKKNAYYLRIRDKPDVVTLCINPSPGNPTLEELPLQPAPGENRFSQIASASSEVDHTKVRARLTVDLSPEGLHIFGEPQSRPSAALLRKVTAIANIAVEKDLSENIKRLEHIVPVKERKV